MNSTVWNQNFVTVQLPGLRVVYVKTIYYLSVIFWLLSEFRFDIEFISIEKIFSMQVIVFKNFEYHKKCKMKIEDNNKDICSRFRNTVFHKTDRTAFGLHIDHPPAWE